MSYRSAALAAASLLLLVALGAGCDDADAVGADGSPPDRGPAPDTAPAADAAADAGADAAADAGPPGIAPYDRLAEPVEILIDGAGLAHVYARSDLDLFFAAGYQQATDRLFAVDMGRRQAVGRLSEVFGADGRSGDLQARVIGFHDLARATSRRLAEVAPDEARFFAAFAGGLNRRIAEIEAGAAPAPAEYAALGFAPEPFAPEELLAIGVRITFGFSSTLEFDLLNTLLDRLAPGAAELRVFEPVGDAFIMGIPDDTADAIDRAARGARKRWRGVPWQGPAASAPPEAPIDPAFVGRAADFVRRWRSDLDVGDGSNCWVVAGEYTDTGRPILANDSHARLLDPNIMYPIHLNSADAGGSWDAIGMAFTGVPGVQVGHNRRVAWGATTHFADMLDLWDVQIRDGMAAIGGEAVPVEERVETYAVRQPDGALVDEQVTVQRVPGYGVIIPPAMLDGVPLGLAVSGSLLLNWPGFEPTLDAVSYFDMARAESVDAWVEAVRLQGVGMQNWMAADAGGIRYQTAGRVPDRGSPAGRPAPNRVMRADDPASLWRGGYLPLDELPALDGSQPYLYSANNDPWGHTADGDPLNDGFYYGSFYAPGFRAARLKRILPEMLAEGPMTAARSQAMQLDVHSPWADELIEALSAAAAGLDDDPALAAFADRAEALRGAVERLAGWDRAMTRASAEAALFRLFAELLGRRILSDDLGLLMDAITDAQPVYIAKFALLAVRYETASLLDEPRDAALLGALDEALGEFEARGEPTWGELHRAVLRAPDRTTRALATPGGDSTLNVAQSRCWDGDGFAETCETVSGAVYRFVTGFADDGTPEADFACPACLPDSDRGWVEGDFIRLPFRRSAVEAAAVETRTLMP